MDAAAYIRVSSRAQDHATQRAAIERAAAARGDTLTAWYAETRSARTLARPELARLRADVRAGLVRKLYVFKLDRLARSGIRDTFEVVEELRRHGCTLVTLYDSFDLDGPAGEIILAVMAWGAKMERLATAERIAAARERLEREGRRWGRPPAVAAPVAARIRRLAAEGRTVRQIAMALGVKRATAWRVLSQKGAYAGPVTTAPTPASSATAAPAAP